jgi:hypothetical protein
MRRLPIILLIVAILFSGGCVDIDYQKMLKQSFAALVEQGMKVAIDQYGGEQMAAVAWTIKYVEGYEWAQPVLKWIDYKALIEHAYDRLWANWYGMLRDSGYDTDAFIAKENKLWYIIDIDCEGLNDELVAMME